MVEAGTDDFVAVVEDEEDLFGAHPGLFAAAGNPRERAATLAEMTGGRKQRAPGPRPGGGLRRAATGLDLGGHGASQRLGPLGGGGSAGGGGGGWGRLFRGGSKKSLLQRPKSAAEIIRGTSSGVSAGKMGKAGKDGDNPNRRRTGLKIDSSAEVSQSRSTRRQKWSLPQ